MIHIASMFFDMSGNIKLGIILIIILVAWISIP